MPPRDALFPTRAWPSQGMYTLSSGARARHFVWRTDTSSKMRVSPMGPGELRRWGGKRSAPGNDRRSVVSQ
eukprot:14760395-Alexandrium_andersonii.AAC.1